MDKYEVVGLLGEGSFGRVYKAKQTSDSRFVALKIISKVSNLTLNNNKLTATIYILER